MPHNSFLKKLILEINYLQVTPWGHRHSLSIGSLNSYTYSSTQFGHATFPGDNQKLKKNTDEPTRSADMSARLFIILAYRVGGWLVQMQRSLALAAKRSFRASQRGQKLLAPLANLWLFRPLCRKKNKKLFHHPKISSPGLGHMKTCHRRMFYVAFFFGGKLSA